ncbi:MAG: hypothetical protein ACK5GN_13200 [Pseudomonadota bacterium]
MNRNDRKRKEMITIEGKTQDSQQTTVERLLNDEQVLVHINPNFPGVVIPPYLIDNRTVTLRLSRYFKGRLSTNDREISAELLFGPSYFVCSIPWGSIWGASSVRGEEFVWTESTPPDILHLVLSQEERSAEIERREARPRIKTPRASAGHLRRVK